MQNYIDRLIRAGMSLGDAIVIVDDFLLEHDKDGLETYCSEMEWLHRMLTDALGKDEPEPVWESNR